MFTDFETSKHAHISYKDCFENLLNNSTMKIVAKLIK